MDRHTKYVSPCSHGWCCKDPEGEKNDRSETNGTTTLASSTLNDDRVWLLPLLPTRFGCRSHDSDGNDDSHNCPEEGWDGWQLHDFPLFSVPSWYPGVGSKCVLVKREWERRLIDLVHNLEEGERRQKKLMSAGNGSKEILFSGTLHTKFNSFYTPFWNHPCSLSSVILHHPRVSVHPLPAFSNWRIPLRFHLFSQTYHHLPCHERSSLTYGKKKGILISVSAFPPSPLLLPC